MRLGIFVGRAVAGAAVVLLASTGFGQAATHHVISREVPAVVLSHAAVRVGAPEAAQQFHLAVALPMRNMAQLHALLARITNPDSPFFRHYLTVAQFADRFGPTPFDYAKALNYFAGAGLQVTGTSANRFLIDLTGNVRDIERVFHVKLGLYKHPTEARLFFAPDREPTVDLDVPVLSVEGLDNFELPQPRMMQGAPGTARAGSGPGGQFIPSDIRAAYYGGSKLTGAGQSLGLMELKGYNLSDVKLLFKTVKQPLKPKVVAISVAGAATDCTCHDAEQALDIEYAIGMAPGLKQVQVYVGNSATSVLNKMASQNTSAQLSTSWGWGEHFASNDALFLEMATQGQTFLTASGDNSSLQASGPWPEEDANLTAVGGTDLVTNGPGKSWKSETGWKDSAGGPSLDTTILVASYQLPFIDKANGGSKTLRNVPDIAGDANFNNYICANGRCEGGWGGTSFASPIWAGYIALANESAADQGKPRIGFLNPALYRLASGSKYPKVLHDQTTGKSGQFSAGPQYDLVTGLGSPKSDALIQALVKGR
ncbi:MAG: S53 family peptidase [Rhizomicrobium sp.]